MTAPKPLVRGDFLFHAKEELGKQLGRQIVLESVKRLHQKKLCEIDPQLDADVLKGDEHIQPVPLFGANGVVHTIHDLSADGGLKPTTVYLRYQDWCVTAGALASAIGWAHTIDKSTQGLLEDFRTFLEDKEAERPSSECQHSALELSERVCKWGGSRVVVSGYSEITTEGESLESLLGDWFLNARDSARADALVQGTKFKGLRASFASKHLRFVNPDRYATLDNILSQAFGFAMTGNGYEAFLQSLEAFKVEYQLPDCIADIEHGLFFLAQPFFSSSPPPEHKPYSNPSPFFGGVSTAALAREYEHVTAFSPVIDIYRSKSGAEHWYGIDRRESEGRRALKFLLLVDPVTAEVGHLSLASKALNMRQTQEYLSYLYPAFSASKARLEWKHLKPFPWEKQKSAKHS